MPTTAQKYADTFYSDTPGGVAGHIAAERAKTPKTSWRRIALDIRDRTDGEVDVAPETLKNWVAEHADAAA